jgi:cysteinyl-tRNA synthetase
MRRSLSYIVLAALPALAGACAFELSDAQGSNSGPNNPNNPNNPNTPNPGDDAGPQVPPPATLADGGLPSADQGQGPAADSGVPPKADTGATTPPSQNPLSKVKYWAYQIQGLDANGAVSKLVASKYDMLVLEPTRTDKGNSSFDSKGMVQQLHATKGKSGHKRIVIAYIDVGEAENWRYYWKSWWTEPTEHAKGDPDFLIIPDPDGWADNFPVAYWDKRWKDIMIYNSDSMLQKLLDDGYDGIYMDWVEAFSNDAVAAEAKKQGKDPAVEMITFIGEIRAFARKQNPNFLVIAQNASELLDGHPEYLKEIDAIAQEQIYYDGDADVGWSSPSGCDKKVPDTGSEYSAAFYNSYLKQYKQAGLPVFNVEYACNGSKVSTSFNKSSQQGWITYVSRRSLEKLTSTPPPGY